MKKLITILTVAILATVSTTAQNDYATKNGFSVSLELGFPDEDYGFEEGVKGDYGSTLGFQLGNRWYLADFGAGGGIALMANWLSGSFVGKTENDIDFATFEATFIEFGPMYSFPIANDFAIDAYYNLEPTVLGTIIEDADNAYFGFGFGHAIGAAFRFRKLNIGIEYQTGMVDAEYTGDAEFDINNQEIDFTTNRDLMTGQMKLSIGMKF